MLCLNPFILLCLGITVGLANVKGMALEERNQEYHPDSSLRWPDGVVHYSIGIGFSAQELEALGKVFAMYEANSCITFVKRITEEFYVSIQKTGNGCYSFSGRQQRHLQPQIISLDTECFLCTAKECKIWMLFHEFLHALGLIYDRGMTDRDNHLSTNFTNMQPGSAAHNGVQDFVANPHISTITASPDGVSTVHMDGFSEFLLGKLNQLYGCAAAKVDGAYVLDVPFSPVLIGERGNIREKRSKKKKPKKEKKGKKEKKEKKEKKPKKEEKSRENGSTKKPSFIRKTKDKIKNFFQKKGQTKTVIAQLLKDAFERKRNPIFQNLVGRFSLRNLFALQREAYILG